MLSNTKHYNILIKFLCSFSSFLKKVLFLFGFFFFFFRKTKTKLKKKCTFLRIFTLPQAQHIVKIRKNVHFFLQFCFEKVEKEQKNFPKSQKRTRKKAQEPSKFMFSINKKKNESKKCCSYHLACFLASFWFFRGKRTKDFGFSKKN